MTIEIGETIYTGIARDEDGDYVGSIDYGFNNSLLAVTVADFLGEKTGQVVNAAGEVQAILIQTKEKIVMTVSLNKGCWKVRTWGVPFKEEN